MLKKLNLEMYFSEGTELYLNRKFIVIYYPNFFIYT